MIDGQQRLLTVLYFMKGRFPKEDKRTEIRDLMIKKGQKGIISDGELLKDKSYFQNFKLILKGNKQLDGKTYETLGDDIKNKFDLRTLRAIFISQKNPDDKNSSMYEIFSRLNTGGMNLKPQEIRRAIYAYRSKSFYELLDELNNNEKWRKIIKKHDSKDKHQKDVEIILRCIALSLNLENYKTSMIVFLNEFSENAKNMTDEKLNQIKNRFNSFIDKIENHKELFLNNNRFITNVFDAIFVAHYKNQNVALTKEKIIKIKYEIIKLQGKRSSTDKNFVNERIEKATEILCQN